jgi:two-component system response regulator FlrC
MEAPMASLLAGPKHILVIEDDAAMTEVLVDVLEAAGHIVTATADGDFAAFHLFRGDPVDLVVSDVGLPGIDGVDLFRRIVQHRPELADRFIFATGAMMAPDVEDEIRNHGSRVLMKPFRFEQLLVLVEEGD